MVVPELGTAVFMVPGSQVKNGEDRLLVLSRSAKSVMDGMRGIHPAHVFSYRGHPVTELNNRVWKRIRVTPGLQQDRVHNLKLTCGRPLRAAGVPLETRKVLLGHRNGDITSHYSAPESAELLETAEQICAGTSDKSPALLVLIQKAVIGTSVTAGNLSASSCAQRASNARPPGPRPDAQPRSRAPAAAAGRCRPSARAVRGPPLTATSTRDFDRAIVPPVGVDHPRSVTPRIVTSNACGR